MEVILLCGMVYYNYPVYLPRILRLLSHIHMVLSISYHIPFLLDLPHWFPMINPNDIGFMALDREENPISLSLYPVISHMYIYIYICVHTSIMHISQSSLSYYPVISHMYYHDIPFATVKSHLPQLNPHPKLVGAFNPSEKSDRVSWDDEIPNRKTKK